MTLIEAYSKFKSEYSDLVILSCYEYDSCFAFHAVPESHTGEDMKNMVFDSVFSVCKEDGELSLFNPMDITIDEYNNGEKRSVDKIETMMKTNVGKLSSGYSDAAVRWLNNANA